MIRVGYQLVRDYHESNLKSLSREILHFIRRLTVIFDENIEIITTIYALEDLEHIYPGTSETLSELYKVLIRDIRSQDDNDFSLSGDNTFRRDLPNISDVMTLTKYLRRSAVSILSDLNHDRIGLSKLAIPDFPRDNMEIPAIKNDHVHAFRSYALTINFYSGRSEVYLSTISELKARLSQSVDLHARDILESNPNRRIQERVSDSYVTNLSSRVYRDLINFISSINDTDYPYNSVPVLYQIQNSSQQSKIDGFNTDKGFENWLDSVIHSSNDKDDISGFSTMELSYWLQKRNLMPVIGHEVSHRVLRNVASASLIPQLLGLKKNAGHVGAFIQRLSNIVRPIINNRNIRILPVWELELMCDLMAATRFGYSFLHCWFIKGFVNNAYTNQIKNEFGRLDKSLIPINSTAEHHITDPGNAVFFRYVLGKALLHWLKVMNLENDDSSLQLAEAVNEHLDLQMLATCSKEYISVAIYIAKKVRTEINRFDFNSPIKTLRSGFDASHCGNNAHFWMSVQGLSKPLIEQVYANAVKPIMADIDELEAQYEKLRSTSSVLCSNNVSKQHAQITSAINEVCDVPWRMDWKIALLGYLQEKGKRTNYKAKKAILQHQNRKRDLIRILTDDYVHRTQGILAIIYSLILDKADNSKLFIEQSKSVWLYQQSQAQKVGQPSHAESVLRCLSSEKIQQAVTKKNLSIQEQEAYSKLSPKALGKQKIQDYFEVILKNLSPFDPSDRSNPFRLRARSLKVDSPLDLIKILNAFCSDYISCLRDYQRHLRFNGTIQDEIKGINFSSYIDYINKHQEFSKENVHLLVKSHIKLLREIKEKLSYYTNSILLNGMNSKTFLWFDGVDDDMASVLDEKFYYLEFGTVKLTCLKFGTLEQYKKPKNKLPEFQLDENTSSDLNFRGNLIGDSDYFEIIGVRAKLQEIRQSEKDPAHDAIYSAAGAKMDRSTRIQKNDELMRLVNTDKKIDTIAKPIWQGWLMNSNSSNAVLTYQTRVFEGISLIAKVYLFKSDYRVDFVKKIKEIGETAYRSCGLGLLSFLSFGSEDAILAFSIRSPLQLRSAIDILEFIYDLSSVSRTERIFTYTYINHLIEEPRPLVDERHNLDPKGELRHEYSSYIDCALKIKLNPRPDVKLTNVVEIMREIVSKAFLKVENNNNPPDIILTNGYLDLAIPLGIDQSCTPETGKKGSGSHPLYALQDEMLNNFGLKHAIQKISTELRIKENSMSKAFN